jgi:hypothetical protein
LAGEVDRLHLRNHLFQANYRKVLGDTCSTFSVPNWLDFGIGDSLGL